MRAARLTLISLACMAAGGCFKASTSGSSGSSGSAAGASAGSIAASAGSAGASSSGTHSGAAASTSSKGTSSGGTAGSSGSSGGTTGSGCTVANALTCSCNLDADCPAPDYLCSITTGLCFFQCTTFTDCTGAEAPPAISAECLSAPSGCACVPDPLSGVGACVPRPCATDSDCKSGQQCIDGACVTPPPANTVTRCVVSPAVQTLEVGQSAAFSAQAYAQGEPIRVVASAWAWSSASASVSVTGSGSTALAVGLAPSAGLVSGVVATVGAVSCSAQVEVFAPAVDAGLALRVVAFDALSGLPVTDAVVQVEGAATVRATSAGEADFSAADLAGAASPYTVSVFEDQFSYVTVVGTRDTDLAIPLIRDPNDVQGGFTGTVANLFVGGQTDIELGVVGTSIPGVLTDTTFDIISGPVTPVDIVQLGVTVPVQGGEVLGFGAQEFKSTFQVTGQPGTCPDAGEEQAGGCGTRSIWTFGGSVPLADIPITGLPTNGFNLFDIGLLSQIGPALSTFTSQLVRNEAFTLGPADDGGTVDPAYLTSLTGLDLASPPAVAISLMTTVVVPKLPAIDGGTAGGAAVVAGVDVPGEGFVPLGFSAGVATGGQVSDDNGIPGQLTLNMAPAHNGVESGSYRVHVIATESTTFTAGDSASVIVLRPSPCAAGSTQGLCFGGTLSPPAGAGFLPLPQSATFNAATRAFASPTPGGADLLRVIFRDANGRGWRVYASASGQASFTLPALPSDPSGGGSFEDRSALSTYEVEVLATGVTLDTLAGFSSGASGATNLGNLDQLVSAFSVQQYPY